MTKAVAEAPEPPVNAGRKPIIIALILVISGAGGAGFAASSGLTPVGFGVTDDDGRDAMQQEGRRPAQDHGKGLPAALPINAYVPLDPIFVSLNLTSAPKHLQFRGRLEVEPAYRHDVESLLPRVNDVLNGYLRALEISDLNDPLALTRLQAQMLRRIQIIAGKDRVRDLRILDFVLK